MLALMKLATTDADRAVRELLRRQGDLITRSQALAAGLTTEVLRRRLASGGPWKIVLPGIYLGNNGILTVGQREIAAVLYAGRGCVITGPAALRPRGVRVPPSANVDVLIPAAFRRQSVEFVRVHRTTRIPELAWVMNGLRYAPAARAVADSACGQGDMRPITALVADALQR